MVPETESPQKNPTTTTTESLPQPSNNTNPITIRRATYAELPAISTALSNAFHDEVLFGRKIHPYRSQYPTEMSYYWLRRFQRNYWDYSQVFLAAIDTSLTPHRICGAAQWHRQGVSAYEKGWGLTRLDPRNLLYYAGCVQSAICGWVWPNRAADPKEEDVIERSYPFLDHVWVGPERGESWYLNFLGVESGYQGKGVGRGLVKWGMEMAEKEGVSASVIAADGKDPFYQACGFDTKYGRAGDGEGNPLGPIPGGTIWFKFFPKKDLRAQAMA